MDVVNKRLEFLRNEVWLVSLNPTIGSEIRKTRPCVVVSPREMNRTLNTVIIAPMTSTAKRWPSRVNVTFDSKDGQIALDQIRALDKRRFQKRLGTISVEEQDAMSDALLRMFGR